MKAKILGVLFGLLSIIIIFSAITSAALELTVSSVPTSIAHNAGNVQILFKLKNTGTAAETGLVWTKTVSQPSNAEWAIVPTVTDIDAGETLDLSAVLTIPTFSSGSVNAKLSVNGADLNINIPIKNTSGIAIEVTRADIISNQSGTIVIKNIGNTNLAGIELTSTGDFAVTFSANSIALAPGEQSSPIEVTAVDLSDLGFGSNTITVKARDNLSGVEATASLRNKQTFCETGSAGGHLKISNIGYDTDGDDEFEWMLLDTIGVEVDIENVGDDSIDDVVVELGLFDSEGNNVADDLDFENADEEAIEVGKLREDDEETVTFTFKVSPDFDEGDYKLAIKVYEDGNEDEECSDKSSDLDEDEIYQPIEVLREDDEGKFIAFNNIQISPTQATCGDSVTVDVDVYNIGDEDQDQVKVNLVNSELGINLEREIRNDMESGDKEKVSFSFIVPEDAEDKAYKLSLTADYDFRRDTYRESSDEPTDFTFNVLGCSITPPGGEDKIALITARLDSDAKAGEELIVSSTITSLSNGRKDLVIRAVGYESWAELNSISERLLSLNEGESKDVVLSFNVNDDAEGEQSFNLEVISGEQTESREIAVNLAEGTTGGSGFSLGNNTLIWVIAIINVVLIILIIIVATRISRK